MNSKSNCIKDCEAYNAGTTTGSCDEQCKHLEGGKPARRQAPNTLGKTSAAGAMDCLRKSAAAYVKTNRTYTGRDGVKRCVYTRGGKSYVKKRDAKTGKMVYRAVKA